MKKHSIIVLSALVAWTLVSAGCSNPAGSDDSKDNGGGSATVSVTGVNLDKTTATLVSGGKVTLAATVLPTNATNKKVTWSSSDSGVATVSAAGEVTAIKDGTATITATTVDGSKKATCEVTVGVYLADFKADGSFMPQGTTWYIIDEGTINAAAVANLKATMGASGAPAELTLVFPKVTELEYANSNGTFKNFPANFTAIELPEATMIGVYAFSDCTSLTSVKLPVATTIGDSAFYYCGSLTSVDLSAATTIGSFAFFQCTGLTSVKLPVATTIGDRAFFRCTSLTSISLPVATTIGPNAFSVCTSLTSVDLPAATAIDTVAFYGCTSLTTVKLATGHSEDLTVGANMFMSTDTTQIDLTLGSGVTGVNAKTWTAGGSPYTFKSITVGSGS